MSLINLLPEEHVQRRRNRRANMLCLVLFGVVMASTIAAVCVSESSSRHTREVRDRVEASYAEATKLIAQLQSLEAKKTTLLRRAEQTASLLERVPRSYLLGMVTNALPKGASLKEVQLQRKKIISQRPAATKFAQHRNAAGASNMTREELTMTITGLAGTDVQVARFIANLARNRLASAVDLVYSEEELIDKKIPVREFQIDVVLRADLDVIDICRASTAPGPQATKLAQANLEARP